MTSPRRRLVESLGDKEFRDIVVEENIDQGIAFQLRAMRGARGWTQQELAKRSAMMQSRISDLEDPEYGSYSLNTLKKLASAFDVALLVRFAPFSELVDWKLGLTPENLAVPAFEDDLGLSDTPSETWTVGSFLDIGAVQSTLGDLLFRAAGGTSLAEYRMQRDELTAAGISGESRTEYHVG